MTVPRPCPMSEDEIRAALAELASGRNLDPPLPEQQALAEHGRRGELARRHHWLVVGLAQKYTEHELGLRPDDDPPGEALFDRALRQRIAAGYPGLLGARDQWEPNRGYKFGTYASWWIRQAIVGSKDRT